MLPATPRADHGTGNSRCVRDIGHAVTDAGNQVIDGIKMRKDLQSCRQHK